MPMHLAAAHAPNVVVLGVGPPLTLERRAGTGLWLSPRGRGALADELENVSFRMFEPWACCFPRVHREQRPC